MANNVLDMLGRAVLRIGGMSPQQIRQQTRANRTPKPMPKANTSRPAPAPAPKPVTRQSRVNGRVVSGTDTRGNRPIPPSKPPAPPAPGSIQPRGQTNLFAQNGNPRNFRNPATAANRPPTLSPVPQRGGQATPPNRPAGGFGAPAAPGQGFFDLGAGQRQGIPNPWGQSTSPNRALVQRTAQGRTAPSVPSRPPAGGGAARSGGGLRGAAGGAIGAVGTGLTIAGVLGAIRDAKDGYDRTIRQANLDKTLPQMTPAQNAKAVRLGQAMPEDVGNRNSGAAGRTQARQAPAPVQPQAAPAAPRAPRSPASSAPVHAAPAQLRAPAEQALAPAPVQPQAAPVQPSVYAPQAGQAPRPSTPAQAVQQQPQAPANPYAGIGDVRGQQLPQSPVQQDAQPVAGTQEYGGQAVQGVNENGIDEERRRAFLDADNSLDGMAAVRALLKRRKLSISVSD